VFSDDVSVPPSDMESKKVVTVQFTRHGLDGVLLLLHVQDNCSYQDLVSVLGRGDVIATLARMKIYVPSVVNDCYFTCVCSADYHGLKPRPSFNPPYRCFPLLLDETRWAPASLDNHLGQMKLIHDEIVEWLNVECQSRCHLANTAYDIIYKDFSNEMDQTPTSAVELLYPGFKFPPANLILKDIDLIRICRWRWGHEDPDSNCPINICLYELNDHIVSLFTRVMENDGSKINYSDDAIILLGFPPANQSYEPSNQTKRLTLFLEAIPLVESSNGAWVDSYGNDVPAMFVENFLRFLFGTFQHRYPHPYLEWCHYLAKQNRYITSLGNTWRRLDEYLHRCQLPQHQREAINDQGVLAEPFWEMNLAIPDMEDGENEASRANVRP
jgi:hypothetical protein